MLVRWLVFLADVTYDLTVVSMSRLMLIQYTDYIALSLVFSMPIWP